MSEDAGEKQETPTERAIRETRESNRPLQDSEIAEKRKVFEQAIAKNAETTPRKEPDAGKVAAAKARIEAQIQLATPLTAKTLTQRADLADKEGVVYPVQTSSPPMKQAVVKNFKPGLKEVAKVLPADAVNSLAAEKTAREAELAAIKAQSEATHAKLAAEEKKSREAAKSAKLDRVTSTESEEQRLAKFANLKAKFQPATSATQKVAKPAESDAARKAKAFIDEAQRIERERVEANKERERREMAEKLAKDSGNKAKWTANAAKKAAAHAVDYSDLPPPPKSLLGDPPVQSSATKLKALSEKAEVKDHKAKLGIPENFSIKDAKAALAAAAKTSNSSLSHDKSRTDTGLTEGSVKAKAAALASKLPKDLGGAKKVATDPRKTLLIAAAVDSQRREAIVDFPCVPVKFDKADRTRFNEFLKQIKDYPETQAVKVVEKYEAAKKNAATLSNNASFLAQSMEPLEKATFGESTEEPGRITYSVTLDREGPLYMPRKNKEGKTVGHDLVYSKPKAGGGFEVDFEKSFIAPDDVPEGVYSSATKDIREKCGKVHEQKFEQGKGLNKDKPKILEAHGLAHDVAKFASPPPPPEISKGNTKAIAAKLGLEAQLKAEIERRGDKKAKKPSPLGAADLK